MKDLTKGQLKIIEPIKEIVGEEFYNLQKRAMTDSRLLMDSDDSERISEELSETQIKRLREINKKLQDYRESYKQGIDTIKQGIKILEDLI